MVIIIQIMVTFFDTLSPFPIGTESYITYVTLIQPSEVSLRPKIATMLQLKLFSKLSNTNNYAANNNIITIIIIIVTLIGSTNA